MGCSDRRTGLCYAPCEARDQRKHSAIRSVATIDAHHCNVKRSNSCLTSNCLAMWQSCHFVRLAWLWRAAGTVRPASAARSQRVYNSLKSKWLHLPACIYKVDKARRVWIRNVSRAINTAFTFGGAAVRFSTKLCVNSTIGAQLPIRESCAARARRTAQRRSRRWRPAPYSLSLSFLLPNTITARRWHPGCEVIQTGGKGAACVLKARRAWGRSSALSPGPATLNHRTVRIVEPM